MPTVKLGGGDINDIKIGNTTINRVYSNGVIVYQKGPNGSPSSLTLSVISDTQINLSWTNGSTNEDGISIERSTDNVTFNEIFTTASGVSTYSNTGLTENTTYYYRVRAFKSAVYSSYSNVANNTTPAPFFSDSLFQLDGTILNSSGTYYFVDKTSNGRNFLITGYDFDSAWTKGFPYKSADTISAPVGDATLIAADVNSFLYTAGTPNQIPVISLFQNIDYKNKLFCRHAAQVVDGNDVETYEPRVFDVVLYNTVKTSTDLTKCNTYFGVPVIDATAKWIDPVNGNDSTGTGTQALPYKTHSKVNTLTLTEGTTVYCLTGTFAPTTIGTWNKNYSLKGIGFTKILNAVSLKGIDNDPAGTLTLTIEGYIIDMNSVAGSNCWGNSALLHNIIFKRMYFVNYVSNALSTGAASSTNRVYVQNCVFKSSTTASNIIAAGKGVEINTCYVNNATNIVAGQSGATGTSTTIKNSKIKDILTTALSIVNPCDVFFYGNKYTNSKTTITLAAGATSGNIYVHDNYAVSNVNATFIDLVKTSYNVYVYNNYVDYSACTTNIINLECSINQVYNNVVVGTVANSLVMCPNNNSWNKTVLVNYNKLVNKNKDAGYLILAGMENTTVNTDKITYAELMGNVAWGYSNYGGLSSATHGIMVGFCKSFKVKYNYSNGNNIGIVLKGGTDVNSECNYNVVKNCYYGITAVSANNFNVYGNTIFGGNININFAQATGIGCTNFIAKNNILQSTSMVLDNASGVINNNVYDSSTGFVVNSVAKSFLQFQGLGYEANGRLETVSLGTTGIPVSPVLTGETLSVAYNTGLDASTNWGIETQLPTIVTKQQGATWDIGSYVH
jgi:hypothetical protein